MRRKLCLLVLVALVAPFSLPQTASAAKTARILVHFDKHTSAAKQKALIGRIGGRKVATVRRLGTAVVRVPAAGKKEALSLLRRQSGVSYAETDGIVHAYAVTASDPLLDSLDWPLVNPLFPDAWSLTTGDSSVVVAVVDSGVQSNHPDLGTLVAGYDFVNNDSDPSDDEGHGTAIAGIIAAQGNNGIGIAGVCWKCQIMPVKVIGSDGSGTDSAVANGIIWAANNGADVINLSLGGPSYSRTLADAVSYAQAKNVVVVAAAGNDGRDAPSYPAADSGVISVGAVDESDNRYGWSNYGSWVQVDAPGCTNSTGLSSSYVNFCGTSAAAPFVSGLAGLARSYNLSAAASSVVNAIEQKAQSLTSGSSVNGLINAKDTLQAIASAAAGPVASFTPSAVSGTAPLTVSFTNTSTSATSYLWSFGDGTSSTVAQPAHTFTTPGTFTVTLTASDGTTSTLASSTITVLAPAPVASFTPSAVSGTVPLTVFFTNTSTHASSYVWSFGDSATSAATSPSHTFTTTGTFNVTLVASDGTTSTLASSTITVTEPASVASFTASRVSGHAPFGVSFKNKSSNATSYLWSFGDSSPHSIEASPSHTFSKAGTYTVTLTSTGPGGQAEVSKTITVLKPLPDLAVSLVRKWSKVTKVHRLASFVVKLRNRGLAADEGVKITIKLPAGAGFTSVSTGGRRCSRALRRVTCSLGTLSAGRVAKLSFVARVVKRANVTVAVSGKRTETSLANNVARVKTR